MSFVLITLLGKLTCADVTYSSFIPDLSETDQVERYFDITEEALQRINQTFIYDVDAVPSNDKKYNEAKINEYFRLETELFCLLVNYYEMKSENMSNNDNQSESLNNLSKSVIKSLSESSKVFFEAFKINSKSTDRYSEVGQMAFEIYKEKLLNLLTNTETKGEDAQNPFVCPITKCKNNRMRIILSMISTTFERSLINRSNVYKRYGIKPQEPMFETYVIEAFLCKNRNYIEREESVYEIAEQVRAKKEKIIANDRSASFMPGLVAVGIGYCIFIYPVEYCIRVYKRFFTKPPE